MNWKFTFHRFSEPDHYSLRNQKQIQKKSIPQSDQTDEQNFATDLYIEEVDQSNPSQNPREFR